MTYQKGQYSGPQEQADAITRESDPGDKAGLSHLEEVGEALYHDNFKGLDEIIKKMRAEIKVLIPFIKKDVYNIINQNIKDEKIIEETLDNLLNIYQVGYGEKEFKELNDYYSTINLEFSKKYEEFFNELNQEE